MSFLHSNNIIHCNLRPENIFFDEFFRPKITGFDSSIEITQKIDQNEPIKETILKGTLFYSAPEVLSNLEYSKSSDVYSFAITTYQIMADETFSSQITGKKSIINHKFEKMDSISESYRNLIEKCLSRDPKLRPSFDEILLELRTNPNFITESTDIQQYQEYINYIEHETKFFDSNKREIKLKDNSEEKTVYDFEKVALYLKGPDFLGNDYLLEGNFDKNDFSDYNNEYKTYIINLIDKDKMKYYLEKEKIISHENKIKCLNEYEIQSYIKDTNNFTRSEITNFLRKMNIISQIDHPMIQKFVGYSQFDFEDNDKPVIIFESLELTLNSVIDITSIEDDDMFLNKTNQLIVIYTTASAMEYLHAHDIIHRDLKPANLCFTINSKLNYTLPKLCGFDIAKEIKNQSFEKSEKIKGTPVYLAPEIYLRKEYSKSSDVYSFGLFMYELVMRRKPFENLHSPQEIRQAVAENGERPIFDMPINEGYRSLIERCWNQDPTLRPTFPEIVQELKTNPQFITDEIDGEEFSEFVKFIDEFPTSFNTEKRIRQFDDINESKIKTFVEAKPCFGLNNMYDTEKNDLLFDYHYFGLSNYESCELEKGLFYHIEKIDDDKNNSFVVKRIRDNVYRFSKSEFINFTRELNIIPCLDHPAILKFIGYNPSYQDSFSIIVEYSSIGSLLQYITNPDQAKNPINETQKLIIIFGISCAFSYLHANNIIHRDLKPANIFLDDSLYPKLSGFNIAKEIKNQSFEKSEKIKGTPVYLAPEIYLRKEYSKSSDVYSFGLFMYELVMRRKPFENLHSPQEIRQAVAENGERPIFDMPINEGYRSLIERCWNQDPTLRPTFPEIVQELKTNPKFITDEIDVEEFNKYVEFIEKSQIKFNPKEKITLFDHIQKLSFFDFNELDTKINFRNVYETELNNILFDFNFININDFEKQKLVSTSFDTKTYYIINKKTKELYCAKRFTEHFENLLLKDNFAKEVNLLAFNHPAIIKNVGYSPVDHKNKPYPVIVTEYASNKTLKNILSNDIDNNEKLLLNDTKRLIIIYGIASGMAFLHSHNIIHCNLKPSQILLDDFLFPKIHGFYNFSKDLSANPIPDLNKLISFKNNFNR